MKRMRKLLNILRHIWRSSGQAWDRQPATRQAFIDRLNQIKQEKTNESNN